MRTGNGAPACARSVRHVQWLVWKSLVHWCSRCGLSGQVNGYQEQMTNDVDRDTMEHVAGRTRWFNAGLKLQAS
jgi:hypothetical protein